MSDAGQDYGMTFANYSSNQENPMTNKPLDNKKQNHTSRILQKISKRSSGQIKIGPVSESHKSDSQSKKLVNQYNVIRNDLMKLRDDLVQGYDMAKTLFDITVVKDLIKNR